MVRVITLQGLCWLRDSWGLLSCKVQKHPLSFLISNYGENFKQHFLHCYGQRGCSGKRGVGWGGILWCPLLIIERWLYLCCARIGLLWSPPTEKGWGFNSASLPWRVQRNDKVFRIATGWFELVSTKMNCICDFRDNKRMQTSTLEHKSLCFIWQRRSTGNT